MPRLILMRHAKSAWDDPDLADIERPLSLRGRLAATLMGTWLAERGLRPDLALISASVRTRQTWARAAAAAGFDPRAELRALAPLYMAGAEEQLQVLRDEGGSAECVLMLGHEPGTSAFLRRLTQGLPEAKLAEALEKFPTAGIAVLDLPDPWARLDWGQAAFRDFVKPKDLV